MGRKLDDLIAALPEDRRERVDARFEELRGEVESLGDFAACRWKGSGRNRFGPQDQAAFGLEDRETSRHVLVYT